MDNKAYIVTVDMGYGHQRAVFPLQKMGTLPAGWIGDSMIISANMYPKIPFMDRILWNSTRKIYEVLSRMHGFPILGKRLFHILNLVEMIPPFYPRRDLKNPGIALHFLTLLIRLGFGKHLIQVLNRNPRPLITSFPICAFIADIHGYKGKIYCLCTDTDIARAWAPVHAHKSRIHYLAPTFRVRERLKSYGVAHDKIFLTGFPVPDITFENRPLDEAAHWALAKRLAKLDPHSSYRMHYSRLLSIYVGDDHYTEPPHRPTTIMFAIGGAGAQARIGIDLMRSLQGKISEGTMKLILVAGTSRAAKLMFEHAIEKYDLTKVLGNGLEILYKDNKYEYFQSFNNLLPHTDILWTKPSELSFYVGLGIPVIMTQPLGSQEDCNRDWLNMMGAAIAQYDPRYAHEWLSDWLDSGRLAHAAALGFINASRSAVDCIESIVLKNEKREIEEVGFI